LSWVVDIHPEFSDEFNALAKRVKIELFARIKLLEEFGPELKRPHVDTLKGSRFTNMKELRFNANDGVWRVAFAFDPDREAILLVAGDKSGVSSNKFYGKLIRVADERFERHLDLKRHAESE